MTLIPALKTQNHNTERSQRSQRQKNSYRSNEANEGLSNGVRDGPIGESRRVGFERLFHLGDRRAKKNLRNFTPENFGAVLICGLLIMTRYIKVAGLFPPPDYAHAAIVEVGGRLVFTAGAVPLDAAGELIGPGDFIAQTRQVLVNLEAALRAAGSDLEYVVNTTVYVVTIDGKDLSDVWSIVRESGLAIKPHTSTLLGVSVLGYSGQLVEITAVGVVKPEKSA